MGKILGAIATPINKEITAQTKPFLKIYFFIFFAPFLFLLDNYDSPPYISFIGQFLTFKNFVIVFLNYYAR